MSAASGWVRPRARPGVRLRVFCFPHAGGAASAYRGWGEALPLDIEVCPVQLPGRGARFGEAPFRRPQELVRAAADALQGDLDRPFALFGHSMGALVAFELARELRRRGWPAPLLLAVSGHHAPHRPDPDPPMAHLPDAEFIAELRRRYDGIPSDVLAEPDLLELLLPVLRADVGLLESYAYADEPPLECALSCFGGREDPHVRTDDLEGWRDHTRGPFALRTFPGSHFFIDSARPALLQALRDDLRAVLAAPGAVHP